MPEKEKRYEGGKNEEVISRDRLHTEFDTAAYLRVSITYNYIVFLVFWLVRSY